MMCLLLQQRNSGLRPWFAFDAWVRALQREGLYTPRHERGTPLRAVAAAPSSVHLSAGGAPAAVSPTAKKLLPCETVAARCSSSSFFFSSSAAAAAVTVRSGPAAAVAAQRAAAAATPVGTGAVTAAASALTTTKTTAAPLFSTPPLGEFSAVKEGTPEREELKATVNPAIVARRAAAAAAPPTASATGASAAILSAPTAASPADTHEGLPPHTGGGRKTLDLCSWAAKKRHKKFTGHATAIIPQNIDGVSFGGEGSNDSAQCRCMQRREEAAVPFSAIWKKTLLAAAAAKQTVVIDLRRSELDFEGRGNFSEAGDPRKGKAEGEVGEGVNKGSETHGKETSKESRRSDLEKEGSFRHMRRQYGFKQHDCGFSLYDEEAEPAIVEAAATSALAGGVVELRVGGVKELPPELIGTAAEKAASTATTASTAAAAASTAAAAASTAAAAASTAAAATSTAAATAALSRIAGLRREAGTPRETRRPTHQEGARLPLHEENKIEMPLDSGPHSGERIRGDEIQTQTQRTHENVQLHRAAKTSAFRVDTERAARQSSLRAEGSEETFAVATNPSEVQTPDASSFRRRKKTCEETDKMGVLLLDDYDTEEEKKEETEIEPRKSRASYETDAEYNRTQRTCEGYMAHQNRAATRYLQCIRGDCSVVTMAETVPALCTGKKSFSASASDLPAFSQHTDAGQTATRRTRVEKSKADQRRRRTMAPVMCTGEEKNYQLAAVKGVEKDFEDNFLLGRGKRRSEAAYRKAGDSLTRLVACGSNGKHKEHRSFLQQKICGTVAAARDQTAIWRRVGREYDLWLILDVRERVATHQSPLCTTAEAAAAAAVKGSIPSDSTAITSNIRKEYLFQQLQRNGVNVEVRSLPVGDALWVARKKAKHVQHHGQPQCPLYQHSQQRVRQQQVRPHPRLPLEQHQQQQSQHPGREQRPGDSIAYTGVSADAGEEGKARSGQKTTDPAAAVPFFAFHLPSSRRPSHQTSSTSLAKKNTLSDANAPPLHSFSSVKPHPPSSPVEYVLPFILERKTLRDLTASLRDGRYEEQKFRLLRCPKVKRIFYLVEGLLDSSSCDAVPLLSLQKRHLPFLYSRTPGATVSGTAVAALAGAAAPATLGLAPLGNTSSLRRRQQQALHARAHALREQQHRSQTGNAGYSSAQQQPQSQQQAMHAFASREASRPLSLSAAAVASEIAAIRTAQVKTQLVNGFTVLQTTGPAHTVAMLTRLHRRLKANFTCAAAERIDPQYNTNETDTVSGSDRSGAADGSKHLADSNMEESGRFINRASHNRHTGRLFLIPPDEPSITMHSDHSSHSAARSHETSSALFFPWSGSAGGRHRDGEAAELLLWDTWRTCCGEAMKLTVKEIFCRQLCALPSLGQRGATYVAAACGNPAAFASLLNETDSERQLKERLAAAAETANERDVRKRFSMLQREHSQPVAGTSVRGSSYEDGNRPKADGRDTRQRHKTVKKQNVGACGKIEEIRFLTAVCSPKTPAEHWTCGDKGCKGARPDESTSTQKKQRRKASVAGRNETMLSGRSAPLSAKASALCRVLYQDFPPESALSSVRVAFLTDHPKIIDAAD